MVMYRNFEIIEHKDGWMNDCRFDAYHGGPDIGAYRILGSTLEEVKDLIDDWHEEQAA